MTMTIMTTLQGDATVIILRSLAVKSTCLRSLGLDHTGAAFYLRSVQADFPLTLNGTLLILVLK